jgi:hypothetical protein
MNEPIVNKIKVYQKVYIIVNNSLLEWRAN